jgi:hypothetical protein
MDAEHKRSAAGSVAMGYTEGGDSKRGGYTRSDGIPHGEPDRVMILS